MVVSHGAGPPVKESHTDDHNSRLYESQHRKSIQGVILNLQRSYDVDLVQASLRKLQVLAHKREVHEFLANKEVHQCIMTAVSHLDLHKNIQKLGCEVLADLVERITDLCATFSQSTTLGQLLQILHTNAFSDAELHLSIMRILARLLDREEIRNQLIMDDGVTDMADILYNTIVTFNDNRYILVPTFTALRHLLSEDNDLQESFMQEKWELVMQCLTTFNSSPEVTQAVLELLGVIAANDQLMDSLVAENIQELVVDRCASMRSSGSMASTCCSLLCRLCASDSVKEFVTAENFLRTTLVPLMYEQRSNVAVQHHGLILLCLLLKYNFSQNDEQNSLDLGPLYDWCDLVNIAMSKHLDNIDVQICSCRAISALMEYRPEARRWIGLDVVDGQNQLPIHTLCLGAILMFRQKSEVFVAACEAIYWLAADNETLSGQLMERNCHVAIIDGLTVHLSEPWAVEAGCKAIRGLCIFHEAYKHVVIRDGIQALITKAMNKFPENPEIQIEVISMLACLGDVDVVRYQCFIDGIHSKILTNLDSFKDNEILQEASLECLSVLSTVGSNLELLNIVDTATHVMEVLENYRESVYIQRKGLILLQVLASDKLYKDRSLHNKLAEVISIAMRTHSNNLGVVKEACVAMQILSEGGGRWMSDSFIKEGCHEILFSLLQRHNSDPQVHDLASECLYVLGLEQVLRSKMLLSACNTGNLPAAECLIELGADVNFVQDGCTPLYIAVDKQDEQLVQLLLKQHITDIQSPLKLSLDQTTHQITGALLGQINKDREGLIMSWAGQGLKELHPDWFVMALSNPTGVGSTESGKLILNKIKKGQEKHVSRSAVFTASNNNVALDNKYFRYKGERRRHHSDGFVKKSNFQQSVPVVRQVSYEGRSSTLKRQKGEGIPIPFSFSSSNALSPVTSYNSLIPSPSNSQGSPSPESVSSQRQRPKTLSTAPHTPTHPTQKQRPKTLAGFPHITLDDCSPNEDRPVFELGPTSPEDINVPVFEASYSDVDEWKTTTLTGANVPYSPSDPRLRQTEKEATSVRLGYKGEWKRKKQNLSPSLPKFESCATSYNNRKDQHGRRLSVPALGIEGDLKLRGHRRRNSEGHVTRSPISSVDSMSSDQERRVTSPDQALLQPSLFDLSCNALTSLDSLVSIFPDLAQSFSCLTKLFIHDNKITSLPDKMFQYLPKLKGLDVRSNCLTVFPSNALMCPLLSVLDLSHNKIQTVSGLEENTTLKELVISHNNLRWISPTLTANLQGLEVLLLSSNNIQELPEAPLGMAMLQTLNLSDNRISFIPEQCLTGCPRLETLDLSNNRLVRLPSETIVTELTRLAKLKLARNQLMEKEPFYIPKLILELPSLRSVDLSGNGLVGLPAPLHWKSTMLKEILLCRNSISKLNLEGAKAWSKLEALNVSNNNISELHKEIGQLTSLTSLDISYNKSLTSLPDELGRCSKMWEMPLKGIGFSLDRIHRGKVKDLIAFLHNKLKKATRYYRMKLMVVGYGGRGKSTLLRALMKQSPQPDIPTVGVIVKDWKFERQKHFDDFHGSVTYTINTWDFAGQEDFYSTHQCYLTDRAVYLVVMDLRRGMEELNLLRSWLANIHARAPGCPVIVVGTHADCVADNKRLQLQNHIRMKLRDLVIKLGFADIQDFVTVNCTKETPEMERLREFIKEKIDSYKVKGQPVMGQKVPADYVKLAEVLEEEVRAEHTKYPIITHTQLLKVVEKHKLDLEEEDLKQAVRFLHRSGVLLHYEDAALQLKDLYFLDPSWLCGMMAQVVNVRQINNGILRREDMKLLLTGKKLKREGERTFFFPIDFLPQYIRVLEKFEIALQYSEEEVLIPYHLPDKRPDLQMPHLKINEKICRHYSMPLVPLGLWSRLITRLVAFSNSALTLTLVEEKRPPTMKYWKKGIFGFWSRSSFFLLDYHFLEDEEIHLMVPSTSKGSTLFGLLVDHITALVEEWYPGLTSLDPVQGRELLVQHVPCIGCTDVDVQKHFLLDDLLDQTKSGMEIYCDVHKGYVPLSKLAPDIILNDVKPELQVDHSVFEFEENPDNLLGDGGYGAVYKGVYKGQPAAIKAFNVIGAVHPHKIQRQEATVLRCLNHPSIVSLLGVSFQPRVIVLELAPKGSLGNVLKSGRPLDRIMQHRIALQVAEGLVYLHQLMIVYRDMKPDNVLIYSLDLNSPINAKVSDYGIARFATLDGLLAQEGTPAYRAPEVIRGESYSFTADVFSYGITLYALLTSGRHPFDEFEFKSDMDRAIAEGVTMPAITQRGASPWPDMENILNGCLYNLPDKRLQSKDIVRRLKIPDILSLRSFTLISKSASLECFTVQENEEGSPVLWFTSGSMEHVELSHINLLDPSFKHQGTYFPYGRILCLQPITRSYLLVGSQLSRIWLYDTYTNKFRHSSSLLPDHVLCIKHMSGTTDDLVFAGLANGLIAVFPVSDIIEEKNAVPMCLHVGDLREPVRCMEVQAHKRLLYASCGSKITVFSTRLSIALELTFETLIPSKSPSPPVYTMALGTSLLLSHMGQPHVQMWEVGRLRGPGMPPKLRHTFNIANMFELPAKQARVTSLTLVPDNGMAWVGTGGGHVALIDLKSMIGVSITHKYSGAIRSLVYLRAKGDFKCSAVISGGLGFIASPGGQGVKDKEYSCLAVWDPNYDQTLRLFQKYLELRKEKEREQTKNSIKVT